MKVVHLNKSDLSGGAARAALQLHKGLQRIGHNSCLFVESATGNETGVLVFQKPAGVLSVLRRGLRQISMSRSFASYHGSRPPGYELFSSDLSPYGATLLGQIPACDVINLHWIPGFVDYPAFFTHVPQMTPIAWTLHDLNPITGGCHYDLGCHRYVGQCGNCPQLGSGSSDDLSREVWERKQRTLSRVPQSRLHLVAASRWVADEVKQSPIFSRFPVTVIPHAIDTNKFAPRNRANARDLLGISSEARVVLFVAENVGNRRKGLSFLLEALKKCAPTIPNLMLLSVGRSAPDIKVNLPWLHLGSADNDLFLSMVYSAADVFVTCALQEAFGLTTFEAMACGTPVVAFGVGGALDMIRNGINGLTVEAADVEALTESICNILNDSRLRARMGEKAREIAIEEYGIELQARRYAELYSDLIHSAQG